MTTTLLAVEAGSFQFELAPEGAFTLDMEGVALQLRQQRRSSGLFTQQIQDLALVVDGGAPGPQGPKGDAALPAIEAVADTSMERGTPVCVNRATRCFTPADARIYSRAMVVGLLDDDVTAGFVGRATAVGTFDFENLVPGTLYYLAEGGGITTTRPTTPGSSVVVIGEAITTSILDIRRTPPILL